MLKAEIRHDRAEARPAPEQPSDPARLRMYLLPLVIAPVLLLALAMPLLRSKWFAARSGDPYLVGLAYGETLHGVNCKIVIYGDSSAEIGLDPKLIEQRTGLSTCNIAEPASMTILNGTQVLDHYLAQNQPPEILLFFYSPENLDPKRSSFKAGLFEAMTYQVRQPGKLAFLMALKRPTNFFKWSTEGLDMAPRMLIAHPGSMDERNPRRLTGGQIFLPGDEITDCSTLEPPIPPDPDWINSLRRRYSRRSTRVVIDTMPVPVCDPSRPVLQQELQGVTDNPVETLPVSLYLLGGRHINAAGSKIVSNMVADQILAMRKNVQTAEVR